MSKTESEQSRTKDLPKDEQPYEKMMKNGPESLTDAELLAIILRNGVKGTNSIELARSVIGATNTGEGLAGLHHISIQQLMTIPGIGPVKAIQLKCICEMSRRIARTSAGKNLDFTSPRSVADYYMEELRHQEQEYVICIMLNTKFEFLGDEIISKGTVNASFVSPREIYLKAAAFRAVNIILVHNHPSGDPTPSKEDIQATRRAREAGEMLGISLVDHIIIGSLRYVSLLEEGIIQENKGE